MNFLPPEVALYLYKSTIQSYMEYFCHVWADALSCYLEFLDKLQKRICGTVGPSLTASLQSLAHRRNVASLNIFYRHYFGRYSSEMSQFAPLPYSRGSSSLFSRELVLLIVYMIFLSTFLDVTRMPMSIVSSLV